jgi:hypothetical protein
MFMFGSHAIDQGSTRTGRWMREHRMRFTLWLAAAEGLIYLIAFRHWWFFLLVAIVAVGLWFYGGRSSRSDLVRQATWIFAVAQLLVLLVPLLWSILHAVAIAVVALLAIAALIFLFTERS